MECNCKCCFEHEMKHIKICIRAAKDTFSAQITLDSLLTHREVAPVPLSDLANCPCTQTAVTSVIEKTDFLLSCTNPILLRLKRHYDDLKMREILEHLFLNLSVIPFRKDL